MAPGPCLVTCSVTLDREAHDPRPRKRLVATASRREGAFGRAGEPSEPFCGEGGMTEWYEKSPVYDRAFGWSAIRSHVGGTVKIDIFSVSKIAATQGRAQTAAQRKAVAVWKRGAAE